MRITFVVPTLNFNGGLRVIAIYANYLKQFGHEVIVVSPGRPRPNISQTIKGWIKRKPWSGAKDFSTVYFDSLNIKLVILNKKRPVEEDDLPDADIVIATWWETAHWVDKLSKSKGKKIYFMQDYGCVPGQPFDKIQATWLLPFHIITISQWLMHLIEDFRHTTDQLTLVSNGIDLGVFNAPLRNKNIIPTVGFLYTDAPQKGVDLMIAAYLKAKETFPLLQLVMFGSKDLPKTLKRIPDVTYFQKLSDAQVVAVYASCDAWLFGSSREGFGLPILEAMACRTPVIATNAGAAAELVTSKSGALLFSNSVDEMAREIIAIASLDNNSWQALSEGAYKVAKRCSWDAASRKFEDTLHEVVADL